MKITRKVIIQVYDNLFDLSQERPSRSKIKKVYQRDNHRCQNCGQKAGKRSNVELHAHHIVPLKDGGSNQFSNLQTLCEDCHKAVHYDSVTAPAGRNQQQIGAIELVVLFPYYLSNSKKFFYLLLISYAIAIPLASVTGSAVFLIISIVGMISSAYFHYSTDLDPPDFY